MKRRENALKRVRDAFTRDRDHDAPCPAQPSIFAGQPVTTVRAPSDRVRTGAII